VISVDFTEWKVNMALSRRNSWEEEIVDFERSKKQYLFNEIIKYFI
jgi:hypothetical protein